MPKGFKDAVVRWRELSLVDKGDDITWGRFARVESRILAHTPRDAAEAADMLEIVIDMTDGRDDGLDVKALRSVRKLLLEQAKRLNHAGDPINNPLTKRVSGAA